MPQTDWFAQNAPPNPVVTTGGDWFNDNAPKQEGAVARYLTHATGLPISDIAAHPGDYLNPLSKGYWKKGAEQNGQPVSAPTLRQMTPFGQTSEDIGKRDYPAALGDITPGAIAAAQIGGPLAGKAMASPVGRAVLERSVPIAAGAAGAKVGSVVGEPITGAAVGTYLGHKISPLLAASLAKFGIKLQGFGVGSAPEVIPPRALPAGPREMPGTIEASPAPAYSPTTRAQRLNLLLPEQAGGKIPLPASTAEVPAEAEASYPGALNKRPTDRAEIVSDKAVEDAMRNDLEKQGWRALSQERKEFYANNQPGMSKGDLVTNARVEAVRTAAEQQVQKILAESNPPVKYTKTVTPKAKVATPAQPVVEDLNSPNRLIDLMQKSVDAISARKGK